MVIFLQGYKTKRKSMEGIVFVSVALSSFVKQSKQHFSFHFALIEFINDDGGGFIHMSPLVYMNSFDAMLRDAKKATQCIVMSTHLKVGS